MSLHREDYDDQSLSDMNYEEDAHEVEEQHDGAEQKKRVRRMLEDRLERKRLREELEDELDGEFDWDDYDK